NREGLTMLKINDLIVQTVTQVVGFIILTLATYLFFSGHDAPGGGFIGGLVLASEFVLILLAVDFETLKEELPVDFKRVGAAGVFIVLASGFSSVFFGEPFLNQVFLEFTVPFFGTIEWTYGTIFEIGGALTVIGVVVTIILSISEDVEYYGDTQHHYFRCARHSSNMSFHHNESDS